MWKIIFGASALASVFLYFFGSIFQAIYLIPIIAEYLVPLGIGKHLALAVAIPVFFWLNSAVWKLFSLRKHKRTLGLVMILGSIAILKLIQGIQTKDDLFDIWDGTPNYSYVMNGTEVVRLPKDAKVDPATGKTALPYTAEVIERIAAEKAKAEALKVEAEKKQIAEEKAKAEAEQKRLAAEKAKAEAETATTERLRLRLKAQLETEKLRTDAEVATAEKAKAEAEKAKAEIEAASVEKARAEAEAVRAEQAKAKAEEKNTFSSLRNAQIERRRLNEERKNARKIGYTGEGCVLFNGREFIRESCKN